jgi:hypothetical protein
MRRLGRLLPPPLGDLPAGRARLEAIETAAVERARAMLHSDRWAGEGCDPARTLIEDERAALIRSYEALLAVIR